MIARTGGYAGWGRTQAVRHRVARPAGAAELIDIVRRSAPGPILAHGCGRSYGDVALNPEGLLVDCRGLDRFVAFDRSTGLLTCEAGVRLADILALLCRPEADGGGFFLPVSPGTRFVTVGGAIANDVHGKNHHARGTFGSHIESFDLLRSDGRTVRCSAAENPELFAATIGGLGLTGIILRATLRLRRAEGLALEAEDVRFGGLDEFFALSCESDGVWEYTAAWIDCFAAGAALGRGIFSRARHAPGRGAPPPACEPRLTVPLTLPVSTVTGLSARLFNALHWSRLRGGSARRIGPYESVLYPLDAVGAWNRLYGPRGFFQFQGVIPKAVARDAVGAMLREVAAAGEGSILAVLKAFGPKPSPGLLSFPMEGATLALDFANRGEGTFRLLGRLERITLDAGGRIYPAKDSLMSPEAFFRGYPAAERFRDAMDPVFSSAFSRRIGLVAR
ncbi:MAG TPA: FAD-binding oxidoreductase [Beijerinckiaceae bacterium]